jgi:hypothetical protein
MHIEEEIQSKGINNLFKSVVVETSPILEKGRTSRFRRLTEQ